MAKISPSLLSADFLNLKSSLLKLDEGGADYIHLDVMDGLFVPNISFGFPVIQAVKRGTSLKLDTHLMIEKPERYVDLFAELGTDILTVHQEACVHLHRTVQRIKKHGILAGVSLNPATSIESIRYILEEIDVVLIMTVNPGFGGQHFLEGMLSKISDLKELILRNNYSTLIEVDGGVNLTNAPRILSAGCDILVSGSDIFGADDVVRRILAYKAL